MADPPWLAQCLENIKGMGGTLCPQTHCDATIIKDYSHKYCYCLYPMENGCYPNRTQGCCRFNDSTAVPVADYNCYCCCGCMANNTPVASDPNTYKAIAEYLVGDLVYVA